jgi:hypothetical protein
VNIHTGCDSSGDYAMLIIKKKTKKILIITHLIISIAITIASFVISLLLQQPNYMCLLVFVPPIVISANFIDDIPVEPDTIYEYLRCMGYSHEIASDVEKEYLEKGDSLEFNDLQ